MSVPLLYSDSGRSPADLRFRFAGLCLQNAVLLDSSTFWNLLYREFGEQLLCHYDLGTKQLNTNPHLRHAVT